MWVFPLFAALISVAFAAVLLWNAVRPVRPAQLMWAIALLMYAVASFAMFLGSLSNWTPGEFRLYWLLGATLTVPYLAQGELYLLTPRPVANVLFLVLVFGTAFAVAKIGSAPVQLVYLHEELPLGKDVFGAGSVAHRLAQLYSIPAYVVLLAGAVWSAWRMRGRPERRNRMFGTLGVAAGATIVAVGSGIGAAYGHVWLFSVTLAAGVAVMFWGFLRATTPVVET
jgi:hypothetical protein